MRFELSLAFLIATLLSACGPNTQSLVVIPEPIDAQVHLRNWDGQLVQLLEPAVPAAVLSGDYVLEVHLVGYHESRSAIRLSADSPTTLRVVLAPEPDLAPSRGLIRVSERNPRYFTTLDGKALYLTGSHTWNNLIDMDDVYPPRAFDFGSYLDFLEQHNHNTVRLWAWELTKADSELYERRVYASPQPWLRTGPDDDLAGLPRFDLTIHNEAYFTRLRSRVAMAQSRGFLVIVMLFEGWGAQFSPGKNTHPFGKENNVNGIEYGDFPKSIYTLDHPRITEIQEAYVAKVLLTLNDLDNVLYEIANESGPHSTSWQYHMINFVNASEQQLPKQHLIGMTFQAAGATNEALLASNADWISPRIGYRNDPPPADGSKVIVVDTDHLGGSGFGSADLVWKSFTRGLHVLMMDRYVPYDSVANQPFSRAAEVRQAMGDTLAYAQRLNLSNMSPDVMLASSGYALADQYEIIAYYPRDSADSTIDLEDRNGEFAIEWLDPATGQRTSGGTVIGGDVIQLTPPFPGNAVAYLRMVEIDQVTEP